jgi:hypothetical protein
VVDHGTGAQLGRPILISGLTADLLDLLEIQGTQRVAITTIEVPLPRHRDALASWGDLEQEDPALRQFQFMDLTERDPRGGMLGDLQLEIGLAPERCGLGGVA